MIASGSERALLDAILRHSPHGVIVCDANGKLILHNVAAERIWAGSASTSVVSDWSAYRAFHADGRPFAAEDWSMARSLRSRETTIAEEIRIQRFDGSYGVLVGSSAPILDANGELGGALSVFADITRLKDLERGSEQAHRRATFLAEVGTLLLSSSLDMQETLRRTAQLVVRSVAESCAIELVGEAPIVAHADGIGADDAPRTEGAQLVIPLRVRERSIGTMTLFGRDGAYDAADREMAERLAQKAALAIENARLYRAEQRARASLERAAEHARRMQAITSELASALSSQGVAQTVLDHGVAALGGVAGALWLLDAESHQLSMLRQVGFAPDVIARFSVLPMSTDSPLTEAVRSRRAVLLESRAAYEERFPDSAARFADNTGFEAFAVAVLPVIDDQRVIGALPIIWSCDRVLDTDERGFLQLIASHCAQGLARARLYEAERRARAEIALLYGLVDAVNGAATIEDVYDPALDVVERALGAQRSSILLFDADGVMRFKAWHGLSDTYRTAVEGHSPWGQDAVDPQPLVVPDVYLDAELSAYESVFRAERVRALLFVPLVNRQTLLGKFMVYSPTPRSFTADEIRMAQSIAAEVAQAIARKQSETEVARLFAEAQLARATAESASRMKDEFLGVVSHELRTPLSAILGWAAILKTEDDLSEETLGKGMLAIERNARAQLKIVEDILDVSRIITGKLVIDPKPTDLASLVVEAIDAVKASASAKNIVITTSVPDDPHMLACDPERMRQIVWNLLSNAIEFTPRGGSVEVKLSRVAATIGLQVRDTGVGISQEFLPHVFERFRQADGSTTRAQTGLGLGLAIVRHLVELHGGQVEADSPGLGMGSTFIVTLPIRSSSTPLPMTTGQGVRPGSLLSARQKAAQGQLHGRRILLVDDERDAREMLEQALLLRGAQVVIAANVHEALEQIARFHPHVVVSDIGMPGEDGYALVRRLRALPGPDRELRAIALTAYARPADRHEALVCGFDEHVAKPIDVATFAKLLVEVCDRPRARVREPASIDSERDAAS